MKNRSVSITGSTGFLGWHLCEAFRDAGWRVRAVVRTGNRKPLPTGVEPVESALDPAGLTKASDGSSLLIHSAALVRAATETEIERVNVGGTRAAVEAANATGARLLLVSSQAAIGPGSLARPSQEDDEPRPLTPYGRSKAGAEAVVKAESRGAWTIVRPSAVYGPRDHGFLPVFRLARRRIFLMVAPPSTPFTFIHVDDLVRGVVLAGTEDAAIGGTFFLGHPDVSTAADLMRALASAFGTTYRPIGVPAPVVDVAGVVGDLCWKLGFTPAVDSARAAEVRAGGFVCSVERAKRVLGFSAAQPLARGVAQTARWYQDQGWV
ncbi:MAG TPA: NAD(P)-dependent oxidoreductase [Vicinamibacterales bacterium]|jgi:nucleoside-diphosphate-sugar epimerase|nr:NAD(P)-dependent oxidoreductase [Vicinamibacterales bacterium]